MCPFLLIALLILSPSFLSCLRLDRVHFEGETLLSNVQQLTFGGSNADPRLSRDGRYLTFQASGGSYGNQCDQIYRIDLTGRRRRANRLSTGLGECISAVYVPNSGDLIYAGTFDPKVIPSPDEPCYTYSICHGTPIDETLRKICNDKSKRLWSFFPRYDIFKVNQWGNFVSRMTSEVGYNAEASISPDGRLLAFTSLRSGDPQIWLMNAVDGSQLRQLTNVTGYNGRPQFSPDGQRVVFQAYHPKSAHQISEYRRLMNYNLLNLRTMEIFSVDVDGKHLRQLTGYNKISWTPSYLADGRHIIFSSNFNSIHSEHEFQLFVLDEWDSATTVQKVTFSNGGFEAFPVIDSSGRRLFWSSARNTSGSLLDELNIFVAEFRAYPTERPARRRQRRSKHIHSSPSKHLPMKEVHFPDEKHLKNVYQLTFGGQNAEGYFSFDSNSMVMQATGLERYGTACDQIYRVDFTPHLPTPDTIHQRLSTGLGVCTCSYFFPDDRTSIHAATFASANTTDITATCPPKKCSTFEAKTDPILKNLCNTSYTWDLFPGYDIYKVNEYGNIIKRLTDTPGYDAEGAVSPDGTTIVFTSLRSGDPELWLMDANGENLRQLTNRLGYDGGPFFSPDGRKVGFRASRPKTAEEIEKYKRLLSYNLVEPLAMELFTINVDSSGMRQVTQLGGSNWAPFYMDDNRHIIFSSNFNATGGNFGAFDLYLVDDQIAGAGYVERVTYNQNGFDAFPMQSPNAKRLIWGSSRNGQSMMDLNLFMADWVKDGVDFKEEAEF